MPFQVGNILFEKYRIDELAGRGAFAEVYRATHIDLNVLRALKVLRKDTPGLGSSLFDEFEQRFKLEVQLGARINHPNVIQVHDVERDDEALILVMEYAPGGSLADRLQQARDHDTQFSLIDALRIATEIAAGLGELHALDAVHRDLKPSNVLFDSRERAKLADFGLAQIPGGPSLRSQLSLPTPHPGTPGYMSPEQEATGKYLKPASDVYALGLLLFEMLTGRNYFGQRPGTKPGDLRVETPERLDQLLASILSENVSDRPWDGKEAAGLLRVDLQQEEAKHKAAQELRLAEEKARQEVEEQARRKAERKVQREADSRTRQVGRWMMMARLALKLGRLNQAEKLAGRIAGIGDEGQAAANDLRQKIQETRDIAKERAWREAEEQARQKAQREADQHTREGRWLVNKIQNAIKRGDWENAETLTGQFEKIDEDGASVAIELRKRINVGKKEAQEKARREAEDVARQDAERQARQAAELRAGEISRMWNLAQDALKNAQWEQAEAMAYQIEEIGEQGAQVAIDLIQQIANAQKQAEDQARQDAERKAQREADQRAQEIKYLTKSVQKALKRGRFEQADELTDQLGSVKNIVYLAPS
jgi:tRNA A-37 threonylcarbamoyl transferase component Bud32